MQSADLIQEISGLLLACNIDKIYEVGVTYETVHAGRDIKDFQDLSTRQVEQNFYLSRWLIDLSALRKSVYYTE